MIHCAPSREAATAMVVEGYGSEAVAKVVLELQGQQPVEVATFAKKRYPFAFWVVAPSRRRRDRSPSPASTPPAGRSPKGPPSPDTRTAIPEPGEVAEPGLTT